MMRRHQQRGKTMAVCHMLRARQELWTSGGVDSVSCTMVTRKECVALSGLASSVRICEEVN